MEVVRSQDSGAKYGTDCGGNAVGTVEQRVARNTEPEDGAKDGGEHAAECGGDDGH